MKKQYLSLRLRDAKITDLERHWPCQGANSNLFAKDLVSLRHHLTYMPRTSGRLGPQLR
jgi:hypothetical protein